MKIWNYLLSFVLLISLSIWFAVFSVPKDNLHIVACDVGQGDGFLIYKGTTQILVDGGPNNKVSDCLEKNIPFWDRDIELIILTHPQHDHYFGLIEVVKNYNVKAFLGSSIDNDTKGYKALKQEIEDKNIKIINPETGMNLKLGDMELEVIWPSSSFVSRSTLGSFTTKKDLNDFSVVFNLSYGEFDALFTGDIGLKISGEILETGLIGDIEYLKVPHHGSKNGLTAEFLTTASPEIAVISVAEGNRYGHPHSEVIEMLRGVKIFRTDISGEIDFEVDESNRWELQ